MRIIQRARGGGKTMELIQAAAIDGGYIIALNHQECSRIARLAEEMRLQIKFPLTQEEFLGIWYERFGRNIKELRK